MPTMPCGKCYNNISPSKSVVCTNCYSTFHPNCTKLKTFTTYRAVKESWICDPCNEKFKQSASRKNLENEFQKDDCNDVYNLVSVKADLKLVINQIESLSDKMKNFEKSITFFSDSMDEFGSKLESALNKITEMENKVQVYELRCNKLETELNILKVTINNTEQLTLANNIEISGIPKTPNENISEIVNTVARVLDCQINSNDVIDSYRGKSRQNNDGKIVVQFNTKAVKDSLINSMKTRYKNKNPLMAKDIHSNFSNSKVFINDQLTHNNKKLLWLAKETAKYYSHKYTWANLTGIFVRKIEGGQIFKIQNLEALQKMDVEKKITALWDY
uniref:Zinc finger PHD-type domain-containing protein n=1 Tax=Schizaphis graminum TaxID=13262 RepID=A0A2S2P2T8_SCHGA